MNPVDNLDIDISHISILLYWMSHVIERHNSHTADLKLFKSEFELLYRLSRDVLYV